MQWNTWNLEGSNSSTCECEFKRQQHRGINNRGKESMRHCIVVGGCRNVSIHGDRWQMPKRGRYQNDSHLSDIDEGGIIGWGRFCHWTDGEECASIVILLALAVVVLTLVEFTQAARVAEGADRPCLPAAPALHPTFCRPVITPRSRRNAAQGHYIIQGVGGRHRLSLFNTAVCTLTLEHIHRQGCDAGSPSYNSYFLSCAASLSSRIATRMHTFRKLSTFTILRHMPLSVQSGLEREG